jgi:hypothetical protein
VRQPNFSDQAGKMTPANDRRSRAGCWPLSIPRLRAKAANTGEALVAVEEVQRA